MFTKFTRSFLHPILRDENNSNYRKVLIYANTLLLSAIAICLYSVYFLTKYPLDSKNISNIFGLIVVLISLYLLRFFSNFKLSLGFIIIGSFPLVIAGVYLTGGIYSSNLIWFIILANAAFFNVSKRVGVFYAMCCFLVYFAFYYLSFDSFYNQEFTAYIFAHHSLDNFFNICFASGFSFLIVYAFANTVDEIQQKIKQVNEDKFKDLNQKLTIKTNEISSLRSNLAKDFHDEMGNKLAGINVLSQMLVKKLKNNIDEETIQVLETIQKRSDELFVGTKDFIWSIDFKSDYVFYLIQYIRDFGEDFFSKLNISFSFESVNMTNPNNRLNISNGRNVVSVFKEAMTNIAKHAEATQVNMKADIQDGFLVLSLTDNGKGFEIKQVKINGLNNMKERASVIDAKFSIQSIIHKGTVLEIKIPLENSFVSAASK